MLAYVYWIITVSFKAAAPLLVHSHAPIGALPGQPRQGCVCVSLIGCVIGRLGEALLPPGCGVNLTDRQPGCGSPLQSDSLGAGGPLPGLGAGSHMVDCQVSAKGCWVSL